MIRFVISKPKVQILKARPKRPLWRKTRTYSRLNKLVEAKRGAIRVGFKSGITKFKTKISQEAVYQAWMSGDYAKIYETIPWADLPEDLGKYGDGVSDVLEATGRSVISSLPRQINKNLRWDMTNPAIRSFVDNRTGELVYNITEDTQAFIARTISRSYDKAITARRVADSIRPAIGLGDRLAIAHSNYVDGLRKQGVSDARVGVLSSKYEDQLLDYRSLMIARTEGSFARNAGQKSVWDAAANQGLIDKQTAKKQWVTDGKPCEECVDLEDQGPIGLDEYWDSDDGAIDYPPAHPNCECGMDMVFEEDDLADVADEGDQE